MAKMNKRDLAFFKDLLLKNRTKVAKNLDYLRSTVLDSTTKEASGDQG